MAPPTRSTGGGVSAPNGEEPQQQSSSDRPSSIPSSPNTAGTSPFVGNSWTALFLAVISLTIYLLVLRPTTASSREEQQRQQRQRRRQQEQELRQRQTAGRRPTATNNRPVNHQGVAPGDGGLGVDGIGGGPARQPHVATSSLSEAAVEVLANCRSGPPHLQDEQLQKVISISNSDLNDRSATASSFSSSSLAQIGRTIGGNQFLVDGVVGFSYTGSAAAAKQISSDQAKQLRQDRARILSRWLTPSSTGTNGDDNGNTGGYDNQPTANLAVIPPPPPKSTVVIGLSYDTMINDTATSSTIVGVLYRLATYYTVLLMVQVPSPMSSDETGSGNKKSSNSNNDEWNQKIVNVMRQSSNGLLTEQILPSHRIMVCQSSTGRVALVRQLRQVGLVVDWDPTVKKELERFGYSVSIVTPSDWRSTASALSPTLPS